MYLLGSKFGLEPDLHLLLRADPCWGKYRVLVIADTGLVSITTGGTCMFRVKKRGSNRRDSMQYM